MSEHALSLVLVSLRTAENRILDTHEAMAGGRWGEAWDAAADGEQALIDAKRILGVLRDEEMSR